MPYEMRDEDGIRKDVKEVMAMKSISARQIMRESGLSHVTVNKFLRSEGYTHESTVIKLCIFLGVNWYKSDTKTDSTLVFEDLRPIPEALEEAVTK